MSEQPPVVHVPGQLRLPLQVRTYAHGTPSGYSRGGCRQPCCADPWNAKQAKNKADRIAKGLAPDDPRHGTPTGYHSWGCRCGPCTTAAADEVADRRSRRAHGDTTDLRKAEHRRPR